MTSMNLHSFISKEGHTGHKGLFLYCNWENKLVINCDHICGCIISFIQQVMVLLNCKTIFLKNLN